MYKLENIDSENLLGVELKKKERKLKHLMACLRDQVINILVEDTQNLNPTQADHKIFFFV